MTGSCDQGLRYQENRRKRVATRSDEISICLGHTNFRRFNIAKEDIAGSEL
jgi:hypothetical protein